MRLIDADALKEIICQNVYPVQTAFNTQDYGMFWTGGIEKVIDEAPTIEAEPVRHLKWIRVPLNNGTDACLYKCTCCHSLWWFSYKYCAECGAKMDLPEV